MIQTLSPLPVRLASMVVVGIVVPVTFFLFDMRLFAVASTDRRSELNTLSLFAVFVVQIGLFGVLTARFIELPVLRWSIYVWCWLLIDLQILAVWRIASVYYNDPSILLIRALFAAQAGLVLMWGMLGTAQWLLRLPATVALVPLLAAPLFAHERGEVGHSALFLTQLLALALICGVLVWQRFKLVAPQLLDNGEAGLSTDSASSETLTSVRRRDLKRAQFGIRHVLIWTTSLAFALGLMRLLGLLSIPGLSQLLNSGLLTIVTAGSLIAIVLVVALWAGLGEGAFYLRWPVLALGCVAVGLALMYADYRVEWQANVALRKRFGGLMPTQTWSDIFNDHWHWLAWAWLAGGLLFATLLMFRTLGYRLVRLKKGLLQSPSA